MVSIIKLGKALAVIAALFAVSLLMDGDGAGIEPFQWHPKTDQSGQAPPPPSPPCAEPAASTMAREVFAEPTATVDFAPPFHRVVKQYDENYGFV